MAAPDAMEMRLSITAEEGMTKDGLIIINCENECSRRLEDAWVVLKTGERSEHIPASKPCF
jgi:hypothetical protein